MNPTAQVGGNHYTHMSVEPFDVIATWPLEQQVGFHRGNALKYIMRMGAKDATLQEIDKAKHYLEKLSHVLQTLHTSNQDLEILKEQTICF